MHPFDCDCELCRYAEHDNLGCWCGRYNCTIEQDIEDKARLAALDEESDEA